jgi:hypothetical protein
MALLLIIVAFMVLMAWKQGRPLKLVLTLEEARKVREQWWFTAKCELKVWAILFVFGYVLVGNALASKHWEWYIYVFIGWCSLMLFSRLAIWATAAWVIGCFVTGFFSHYVLKREIPSLVVGAPLTALMFAIILRALGFLMASVRTTAGTKPEVTSDGPLKCIKSHTPEYDWDTDTWLYENGNRERAFIRFRRYEHKNRRDRD